MNKKAVFFLFVGILAGFNLGTIRHTEDPIRDTQTNPILYEQKKEEEKDGKKGPLLYHVTNYPRETFFIDPPYETGPSNFAKAPVTKETPGPTDLSGWWEEQPVVPREASPAEAAAEPLPEALPETEEAPDLKATEQSATTTEAESAPAEKGNDYWW